MNRRTVILLLGAILALWTAAVFLPARNFSFVNWDDYDEVAENPLLHPATTEHLRQIWSTPYLRMYSPLSYSAWWLLMSASESHASPYSFHLFNVALHVICVALVFSILLTCVRSPIAAFGGAAIFALHPLQVESVAWVAEMSNLLAAALSLAAIRLYFSFRLSPGNGRWWLFAAASVLYLLALFAKATSVVTPLIAAILDIGFLRTPPGRTLKPLSIWLIAAAVFGIIARRSQLSPATPLLQRPLVAMDALAFYIGKLFWPAGLTIDYGRTPTRILSSHIWVSNATVILVMILILVVLWQSYRGVPLGALVMLAGLLPVLGFIGFGFQEYSTVADHFMYMAMLGPALAAAVILSISPGRIALPVAGVLTLGIAVLSVWQLHTWTNSATLVRREMEIDPGSSIANDIVGVEWQRARRPDLAVQFFTAAVGRDPQNPFFRFNLANSLFFSGQTEKAIEQYQTAIPLFHPPNWRAMNNLGLAYLKAGRPADAKAEFETILQLDPNNPAALQNLHALAATAPSHFEP